MTPEDEQQDKWQKAVMEAPQFACGRLDMSSYTPDGEPCRFVYVGDDLEEPRYQITGRWCDEISFAAAHYQEAIAQITELEPQLRGMEIEIANLQLANDEARKTIDRAHEQIATLDPQFNDGGP